VVERNLQDSARIAAAFFQDQKVRRILLGGTEETLAPFTALLPRIWQAMLLGTFHVGMEAGSSQVMERAMAVTRANGRRRLALRWRWQRRKDGRRAGLSARCPGRCRAGQTLVFRDGLRAAGWVCTGCGSVGVDPAAACPFCGKRLEPITDVVEHAVRRLLADGGEIEVLPANGDFEIPGGIGAFLRYENPAQGGTPGP
jgi:hypothetical protein